MYFMRLCLRLVVIYSKILQPHFLFVFSSTVVSLTHTLSRGSRKGRVLGFVSGDDCEYIFLRLLQFDSTPK
jgi:hypothetical protein